MPAEKETHVCAICGKPDAQKFGDRYICADCYEAAGSCCMEFGADDFWAKRDEDAEE